MHNLKISSDYFIGVRNGTKQFEVRENDRNFKVGDIVILEEFENREYTGNACMVQIIYVLNDENYCIRDYIIFGFKLIEPNLKRQDM